MKTIIEIDEIGDVIDAAYERGVRDGAAAVLDELEEINVIKEIVTPAFLAGVSAATEFMTRGE